VVPFDVRVGLAIAYPIFECQSVSNQVELLSLRSHPSYFFDYGAGHHIVGAQLSILLDDPLEESVGFLIDKGDTRQINHEVSAAALPGDRTPRALHFPYPGTGKPAFQDQSNRFQPSRSYGDEQVRFTHSITRFRQIQSLPLEGTYLFPRVGAMRVPTGSP
jgi:hypothetical protein